MANAIVPSIQWFDDRGKETSRRNLVSAYGLGTATPSSPIVLRRALFGFSIPYLPDFLADYTLIGQSDAEKLNEVLERQIQLITNLWKWQNAAFSIRFLYDPQRAAIQTSLLVRLFCRPENAESIIRSMHRDLDALTQTFGIPVEGIDSTEQLTALRSPGLVSMYQQQEQSLPFIIEIRQREDMVHFTYVNGDAYIVYPYWKPRGTFIRIFETMMRQSSPCMLNLHIEPTRLSDEEYRALSTAASVAQTASDWQRNSESRQYSGRWADPQAVITAQILAAQLRRLNQPYAMVAQVASGDQFTALGVAQTVGSAIASSIPLSAHSAEENLPTGFDIIYPQNQQELQAAARTLNHLILTPWGSSYASQGSGFERMRYLTDAKGACALFRFPVAVRGGVPGIVVRQPMPDFETGGRSTVAKDDELHLGSYQRGGAVTMKLKDLSRHGLITGLPGSGKTNTCLYILSQLKQKNIPFLVIEPTKTEYRGLHHQPEFDDLLVFSLGDETTSPFRLNPFQLLPGVRLEVHLQALNVAINAVLPQFGVLPTIIEEALEEVYRKFGWELTDRGGEPPARLYPNMQDFYRVAVDVVNKRGYVGEMNSNVSAAVKGRLGSLLRGSKGSMFNCRTSLPIELLLERQVVLEMDALNDDVKSLAIMFLLILIREYRQLYTNRENTKSGLQHVILIEEAHRVMENVSSVNNPEVAADTRAKAVRMLTDFLVEIRSYGQGILIAEQSPEKLAPDAVRNTNLKLTHMLPGRQDRDALASAMIMDEEQERFMGKLRVGQAAVFMTGFEKATFMQVPNYKDTVGFNDFTPDSEVADFMKDFHNDEIEVYLPNDGCRFCERQCKYRQMVEPLLLDKALSTEFTQALMLFDTHPDPGSIPENWRSVVKVCRKAVRNLGVDDIDGAAYCYFSHEIDFPFNEHMRKQFVASVESLPAFG